MNNKEIANYIKKEELPRFKDDRELIAFAILYTVSKKRIKKR